MIKIEPLRTAFGLLERKQQLSWFAALIVQGFLSLIDLFGVFLVGLTATMSVRGIQGSSYGSRIDTIIATLGITNLSLQSQVFSLASLTLFLFTSKTILSAYLTKRMIKFFSLQGSLLSYRLFRDSMFGNYLKEGQRNTQEFIYAISTGVNAITQGIYIQSMQIFTDTVLLIVIVIGILFLEPISALSLAFVFGITGLVLALTLGKQAGRISRSATNLITQCNTHLESSFNSFRDIYARGSLGEVSNNYKAIREQFAIHDAKIRFLPLQSKFIMETVMVSSIFIVAGIQFLKFSGTTAIGSLSIFLAATLRVAPAILRIQQSYLSLRGALTSSFLTFELIEKNRLLASNRLDSRFNELQVVNLSGKTTKDSAIILKNVSFRYGDSPEILKNISLDIPMGSKVLVVGDSGSGKSTLLDLILGIHTPTKGEVQLFGSNPRSFVTSHPGTVSYVTQRIWIPGGKIRDCLNFGHPNILSDRELIKASELTQLANSLSISPKGLLDLDIGPYGSKLSGGQLQRLGITRAVIGNPKLLILDESTNALDAKSEIEILENVYYQLSKATILTISHRPSAIQSLSSLFLHVEKNRFNLQKTPIYSEKKRT